MHIVQPFKKQNRLDEECELVNSDVQGTMHESQYHSNLTKMFSYVKIRID